VNLHRSVRHLYQVRVRTKLATCQIPESRIIREARYALASWPRTITLQAGRYAMGQWKLRYQIYKYRDKVENASTFYAQQTWSPTLANRFCGEVRMERTRFLRTRRRKDWSAIAEISRLSKAIAR